MLKSKAEPDEDSIEGESPFEGGQEETGLQLHMDGSAHCHHVYIYIYL